MEKQQEVRAFMELKFIIDSPFSPDVAELLKTHLELMRSISPPESVHALDQADLEASDISFWSIWKGKQLCGCCALKEHSVFLVEIKSMHTSLEMRGMGIGDEIVKHLIRIAKQRGYHHLSLETGAEDDFIAARKLYEKHGFKYCKPFANYSDDPNSVFMTLGIN